MANLRQLVIEQYPISWACSLKLDRLLGSHAALLARSRSLFGFWSSDNTD